MLSSKVSVIVVTGLPVDVTLKNIVEYLEQENFGQILHATQLPDTPGSFVLRVKGNVEIEKIFLPEGHSQFELADHFIVFSGIDHLYDRYQSVTSAVGEVVRCRWEEVEMSDFQSFGRYATAILPRDQAMMLHDQTLYIEGEEVRIRAVIVAAPEDEAASSSPSLDVDHAHHLQANRNNVDDAATAGAEMDGAETVKEVEDENEPNDVERAGEEVNGDGVDEAYEDVYVDDFDDFNFDGDSAVVSNGMKTIDEMVEKTKLSDEENMISIQQTKPVVEMDERWKSNPRSFIIFTDPYQPWLNPVDYVNDPHFPQNIDDDERFALSLYLADVQHYDAVHKRRRSQDGTIFSDYLVQDEVSSEVYDDFLASSYASQKDWQCV